MGSVFHPRGANARAPWPVAHCLPLLLNDRLDNRRTRSSAMADSIPPRLLIERRSDRVVATLDRPATRNAIDLAMVDELHALCAELEEAPAILILTGADGVFASGADIAELRERRA